jgi:hypothetical protein
MERRRNLSSSHLGRTQDLTTDFQRVHKKLLARARGGWRFRSPSVKGGRLHTDGRRSGGIDCRGYGEKCAVVEAPSDQ